MPRYDYEVCDGKGCEYCGGTFEVFQSMKEEPLKECPMCDRAVRRLFSTFGVKVPKSNADLKSLGFMKLKKTSDGSYENLTRKHGEPKIIDQNTKLPPNLD
jgi:putative FmdB family regulatory protein